MRVVRICMILQTPRPATIGQSDAAKVLLTFGSATTTCLSHKEVVSNQGLKILDQDVKEKTDEPI
ncbi:hypothetical protein [Rosistilla oblonga]|uniref:hypothetical protein n=1 Tax=Rosistilla oblonga TaxID=2527990 RepID=UPI003A96B76E